MQKQIRTKLHDKIGSRKRMMGNNSSRRNRPIRIRTRSLRLGARSLRLGAGSSRLGAGRWSLVAWSPEFRVHSTESSIAESAQHRLDIIGSWLVRRCRSADLSPLKFDLIDPFRVVQILLHSCYNLLKVESQTNSTMTQLRAGIVNLN